MEYISIIVPIYHGEKYIKDLIRQVEDCVDNRLENYELELVLVNDDPDCTLDIYHSKKLEIRTIETDKNRGIHGARVRGLNYCKGDYVLFLDQDDKIYPDYFNSQLMHIADKDAVVCKLLHEEKPFYDNRMPFEQVITKEYIISVRNPIISPGQVLLKKNKIPQKWTNIVLKNNGADDWLLWLCMTAEEQEFALNPEIMFEHVIEGENESINVKHMMDSEKEMYEIVKINRILIGQELEKLRIAVDAAAAAHIGLLVKFQKMFFVCDAWLQLQEQDIRMSEYLRKCGVYSVAIYGYSQIGKRLYHTLEKEKICVKYFIDLNATYLNEEIPIYLPEVLLPQVDLIIISLVEEVDSIKEKLSKLLHTKIYGITELLKMIKLFAIGRDNGI